jgi:hypothetical protein
VLHAQDLFLAGIVDVEGEKMTCRITSALTHADSGARQVTTASGRTYELVGPPASTSHFLDLVRARLTANGLNEVVDVSDRVWAEMRQRCR